MASSTLAAPMKNSSRCGARASVAGDSVAVAGAVGGLSRDLTGGVCARPTLLQVRAPGTAQGRFGATFTMFATPYSPGAGTRRLAAWGPGVCVRSKPGEPALLQPT